MGEPILGRPIAAKKPPPKAGELSSNVEEWPPELRAKFEQKLEVFRRAWEDSRDLCAVVDAMWLVENGRQPVPPWLAKAAKFPSDRLVVDELDTQLVRHSMKGPLGTPQDHFGSSEFCQYAIQKCFPSVNSNIVRKILYADVCDFLKTDSYFLAAGLPEPSDDTIERALAKVLLKRP
jgi:hypothetical protein